MNPEDVVRDCRSYSDTVAFFFILYNALQSAGIRVEVEQRRRTPSGGVRCPDFAVFSKDRPVDILEHKASLTDASHTVAEFNDVAEKYSRFVDGGSASEPQVTLLYPARQDGVVRGIRARVDSRLTLCSFDQATSDTAVSFDLKGPVNSKELEAVLRGAPLTYDPAIVRSRYKFIRADPPVPYTALEVWGMFPSFRNVKEADLRTHDVSRAELLKRMQVFYPPWIRDNLQVSSGRVDAALTFLASSRFVEWRQGTDRIRVDSRRGTRSGDLLEALALAYVKMLSRKGRRAQPSPPPGQTTLDRTWDTPAKRGA